jgi:hypothetical protein
MDLLLLTDDELNTHRIEVITELERRANLAAIPAQVALLAVAFITAGGEQAELDAAVAVTPETPVEETPVEETPVE